MPGAARVARTNLVLPRRPAGSSSVVPPGENHPDHEAAKESLKALKEAIPRPIPFEDLDFNFGE